METLTTTILENSSSIDTIQKILIVSYTALDIAEARARKLSITQYIVDQYNSGGWTCSHTYDCCGCWASFVTSIKHIKRGYKVLTITYLKNV